MSDQVGNQNVGFLNDAAHLHFAHSEDRSARASSQSDQSLCCALTVKFLNFRTPENIAVIYLKFKQRLQIIGNFIKKVQIE